MHAVRGQVLGLAAEAIRHPRPERREAHERAAAVQFVHRRRVDRVRTPARPQEADVIDAPSPGSASGPRHLDAPLLPCFASTCGGSARITSRTARELALGAAGRFGQRLAVPTFRAPGFGSNRSICDGPPTMNKKMTRLAFGSKCGASSRRADSCPLAPRRRPPDSAAQFRAMPPRPPPARNRKSRRDWANGMCVFMCVSVTARHGTCKEGGGKRVPGVLAALHPWLFPVTPLGSNSRCQPRRGVRE